MFRRQGPGVPTVLVSILCATILIGVLLVVLILPTPALNTGRTHVLQPRALMFHLTGEEALASQLRGTVQWALGQFRPRPQTRPDVPVAHTDLPPFGINTELEQEVELEKRARVLQMIADAGFHWIRQPFTWADIEIHDKDDFEDRRNDPHRSAWDKYDHIVDLSEAYDLQIIARLGAPPAWSRHDGTTRGAFGPPDRIEDFADFAAIVAARYVGRIHYYQIWNEPNVYPEWGNQPVDPEAYTTLLCTVYHRLKAVDPNIIVISGAMAQTQELGTWNTIYQGNNMMDTVFLQRMYAAGAADCFDIMAVNDYMLWSGPTDHRLTLREVNFSRPMWMRDVMVMNGDAHKPIWISEMNSNAAPEGIPERYGRVTLEQQARWAPLAFERIQREWPWVGVTTVWFFKKASDAEQQDPSYYFRLVDPDFTPMPVYHTLSAYFNTLEPTLYPGYHQESAWQVTYTGDWEEVADPRSILGSYRRTTTPGHELTLLWEGRSLWLYPGPGSGTLQVRDGTGRTRDLTVSGAPIRLDRSLVPERRSVTLTLLTGEASIDAFRVR
jgi:polysaccharide biosynthesis protein PslG